MTLILAPGATMPADLDPVYGDAPALLPVVSAGDYRASLEALRDRLAAGIDGASSRQLIHLAPLAKQLAEIMRLLEDLPDADAPADSVEQAQENVERMLRAVR